MDATFKNFGNNASINQSTLIWAIVCSFLLHVMFFVVVPNFNFDVAKAKPTELTIELVQPKEPEPAPVVIPEPIKPEPIKPEPIKKLLEPKPVKIDRSPEPVQSQEPVSAAPEPPAVITAEPKVDASPVITMPEPPPEPPKKIEPTDADISNALNQYGGTLGRAIAKHKSYPKIAQMRGWQGDVMLDLKLDSNGNVQSASVKESSGFESLDKQALEMARKASPFPTPPDALRGRSFNITVPVSFKLE